MPPLETDTYSATAEVPLRTFIRFASLTLKTLKFQSTPPSARHAAALINRVAESASIWVRCRGLHVADSSPAMLLPSGPTLFEHLIRNFDGHRDCCLIQKG